MKKHHKEEEKKPVASKKEKHHDKEHHENPSKGKAKIEKVLHEYKADELHSGSKKGPLVKNRKQAIAIALSESRKAGNKIPKKKSK